MEENEVTNEVTAEKKPRRALALVVALAILIIVIVLGTWLLPALGIGTGGQGLIQMIIGDKSEAGAEFYVPVSMELKYGDRSVEASYDLNDDGDATAETLTVETAGHETFSSNTTRTFNNLGQPLNVYVSSNQDTNYRAAVSPSESLGTDGGLLLTELYNFSPGAYQDGNGLTNIRKLYDIDGNGLLLSYRSMTDMKASDDADLQYTVDASFDSQARPVNYVVTAMTNTETPQILFNMSCDYGEDTQPSHFIWEDAIDGRTFDFEVTYDDRGLITALSDEAHQVSVEFNYKPFASGSALARCWNSNGGLWHLIHQMAEGVLQHLS